MFKIRTYNAISVKGLERFARDRYEVGSDIAHPDAYLLRSHKLQGEPVPDSLLAVARAAICGCASRRTSAMCRCASPP